MSAYPSQNPPFDQPQPSEKRRPRYPWWPILIGLAILLFLLWQQDEQPGQSIPYTRFKKELKSGNIHRLVADGDNLTGEFKTPITVV
ncbi:ATP-dependent metallopeptidase FtsH/Yme1/Tma family protein [bacterium]|nr:ATP-dependent metallopeptidase FtsH/Yme1/Tma family protein [bacterium]